MKRLINLCIFLFMSNLVFSQAWMHYLPSHKAENEITFYDCQEAFQRWCREKNIDSEGFFINDSGNKQKAYGFKQFRRWEIAMEGWYDQMTGEIFRKVPYHEYEQFRKMYLENTESVVGDWVNVAYSQAGTWNNGNGRVNCIALHPDDPDIFWIGTAWGGIWETQDHGATWTPKSDFIGGLGIGAIAVPDDYATSHTIYLGTGDRGYYSDYGVGLLKSTDDGNTWFATGLSYSEPVNTYIGKILIHPDNNNIILAATSEGIYKSVDAGANFSMVWTGRTVDMEFHPTNPDIVYATTRWVRFEENTKILRSVNGGQAWEIIQTVDGCRTELAVSPDEPGWVYAIVGNYQEGLEGVYRSTDSGASFTKVFDGSISGNNILGGDCAGVDIGGQAGYDLAIAADANDAQKVTIGGISIWQSNNGGAAWTPLTRSYHNCGGTSSVVHVDIHYLLYRDDSDTLFATSDGGVYYSVDNGINWINISTGLFINQPYRVSSSAAGYDEILMGQQDNGVVLWDNNTANFVGGGDGTNVIINPLDINNQYFTNNSSAVTCTNDHWATKYYFNTPTDSTVSWFKAMHLIPPDTIFYGAHDLWKSTDRGVTMTKIWDMPEDTLVRIIKSAPSNRKIIYLLNQSKFYKSTDGGNNWSDISAGLPCVSKDISSFEIKHQDPNTLWMTTKWWDDDKTIYKSTDGGISWFDFGEGMPDAPWHDILQNNLVTGHDELYACGFFGVFLKLGDADWVPFMEGLPNLTSFDIDIRYDGNLSKLIAGTHGRGVWESDLYGTSGSEAGTWLGTISSSWLNPGNWSMNTVPNGTTDVLIPGTAPNFPVISAANAIVGSLRIYAGASLTISAKTLNLAGDAIIYGTLIMTGTSPALDVDGDIYWKNLSEFSNTGGTGSTIIVDGDWTFEQGSHANLIGTTTRFTGILPSVINAHSNLSNFGNLSVEKTSNVTVFYPASSSSDLSVQGDLIVGADGGFTQHSYKKIKLYGMLNAQGGFSQQHGKLEWLAGGNVPMTMNGGFLNTLEINMLQATTQAQLQTDISVRDSLIIRKGILKMNGHDLQINGNLMRYNNGSLDMDNGWLVFFMNKPQKVATDFVLENVELNKVSDTLRIALGVDLVIDSLNWTAGAIVLESGSSLTINDLHDDGIYGAYRVKAQSVLNLKNPTGSVDLNGKLFISGGTVNVFGGNHASYWPGSANAELHLSSGTLDFKDKGIFVLDHPSLTLLDNITGGSIIAPSFEGDHHAFNPAGGVIQIFGPGSSEVGHGIGSSFYKLVINKPTASDKVTVMTNLDLDHELAILSGNFDINGKTVDVAGPVNIYGKLTMINPTSNMIVRNNISWRPGSETNVTEGTFELIKLWTFMDGTNALLSGNNTILATGDQFSGIYHQDDNATIGNLIVDKSGSLFSLDESALFPFRATGNVTVNSGNTFRINTADAIIAGSCTFHNGANPILSSGGNLNAANMILNGTLNIPSGFYLDGVTLDVNGTLNLTDGGTVSFDNLLLDGTIDINAGSVLIHNSFTQSAGGTLTLDGGSFIIDKPYSGNYMSFSGSTNLNGGFFEISYDGIQFGTGAVVNFNGGNLRVGGNFRAINPNSFQPSSGAVELINTLGANIECSNGNFFHQLIINKSGFNACMMTTDMVINEDLVMTSGELWTLSRNLNVGDDLRIETNGKLSGGNSLINVGGDWINNRGTAGFAEGNSSVWLETSNPSVISSETFYNLDLAKNLAPGQYVQMLPGAQLTVAGDMTFGPDGALLMDNNTILNVNGNLHIKNGGGLNANPSATNTVINCFGHWWDYNTASNANLGFYPGYSTVNFKGSAGQELLISGPGVSFFNLNIQKSANGFTPFDNVTVLNDFSLVSGTWRQSADNITFRFGGDFHLNDPGLWLDQANLVIFDGQAQQNLTTATQGLLNFRAVQVNRPAGATDSGSLDLMSDLQCLTDFDVISGDVNVDGYRLILGGGVQVLPNGDLHMSEGSSLYLGPGASLFVNGGSFSMTGASDNRSRISRSSTGYFEFLVDNGGGVDLSYTDVEYTDVRGLYIESGGLITGTQPLFNCSFGPGEASGMLITIKNAQNLTCNGLIFPANTWSGSRNISKTLNSGMINLPEATGAFAGPGFEDDQYNRINWPSNGYWDGDVSSDWHNINNWRYNFQVPDANTDVIIPTGKPNYPVISALAPTVKTLKMDAATSLTIPEFGLTVSDWADVRGSLNLGDNEQDQIDFYADSLVWQPGSSASAIGKSTFWIEKNMFIRRGSNLDMNAGEFRFYGTADSKLICHDTAAIFGLFNAKTAPAALVLSGDTLAQLTVKGGFVNGTNAILKCPSSQEWVFDGNFRNTANGHFRCEQGTIRLSGPITSSYFRVENGDYFHNLVIDTLVNLHYATGYSDTLRVNGNLVFAPNVASTSQLTANSFRIMLRGDWINNAGSLAFTTGAGQAHIVNFYDPAALQEIHGNTNFQTVYVSNESNDGLHVFDQINMNNLVVVNPVFVHGNLNALSANIDDNLSAIHLMPGCNMTINSLIQGGLIHNHGGNITIEDLSQNYLSGSYIVDAGLTFVKQAEYSAPSTLDLYFAHITINGGELRLQGGSSLIRWPSALGGVSDLTMTGGLFYPVNHSVEIIPGGFVENITGGTLRIPYNFYGGAGVTTFHPTGGVVEFYDDSDADCGFFEESCWFHDVHINKNEAWVYPYYRMRVKNELRLVSGFLMVETGNPVTVGP